MHGLQEYGSSFTRSCEANPSIECDGGTVHGGAPTRRAAERPSSSASGLTAGLAAGLAPVAICSAATAVVAAVAGEWTVTGVLAGVAVASALLGRWGLPRVGCGDDSERRRILGEIATMWIGFAVGSSVAGWAADAADTSVDELADPLDAVFETISGLTTTGFTLVEDPSILPAWMQFWRSVLHAVGAVGVVLFAVVAAEPSGDRDSLVDREWGTMPRDDANDVVRVILGVHAGLTLATFVALMGSGDPIWVAFNHSLSATATGGFTMNEGGVAALGGASQGVLVVSTILAATAYGTLWDRVGRRGVPLWKRTQFRWTLVFAGSAMIVALLVAERTPIWTIVFRSVSATTTSGFSLADSELAPGPISVLGAIAIVSMLIGGAAGSTAGGLKVARVAWLFKALRRWLPGRTVPSDEAPYRWDDEDVESDDARVRVFGAAAIATSWLLCLSVGTVILLWINTDVTVGSAMFDATSALSNVGLSSGTIDDDRSAGAKGVLTTLMLLGRVEVTAMVVLLLVPLHAARRALDE